MSDQCDIGRIVVRKKALRAELDSLNRELKSKCRNVDLPFAVTVDDQVITVKDFILSIIFVIAEAATS
jgi:hypothetical protein